MPLVSGTRLGPYEILGPLGAGGMGEVYHARDTRLDRSVAIKVIPAHLAAETEVRQRFEREARAVSSLNHPHICVLYDIGHEGSTHYFVMEHLEGETLAARLEKGPLPTGELLRAAIQVADALAAAHRAGLIHRDLKPGNIMLTRAGAKLLDFGLARATGLAANPGSGLTQSPTLSRPLTAEGTIVGTFQYMAPEQLEGKEADARTDLFAFGAVLYEMATGTRAFEGTSQASLIASILKENPRPMGELAPMTPPALEHVVRRCLAKDPDERWQNASDLKHELEWIRDAGSQAGVPAPVAVHRRRLSRASWVTAVAATAVLIAMGSYLLTHRPQAPQAVRFNVLPPPNHTLDVSQTGVTVSPDGTMLAFVANDSTGTAHLWLRRFDSIAANPVPGTQGALHPFWSPDGMHIAFFAEGKLRRVSVAGGSVQSIADAPDPRGGSWGVGGDIVFQRASGGPLHHVRASGGDVHAVTTVDTAAGEEAHRFPCFLPDGKHFLFVTLPAVDGLYGVRVGSLDGEMTPALLRTKGAVVFAPPDRIIYARDQQLVVQTFDPGALKIVGDPVPLGEAAGAYGGWTGAPGVSASANGVLVHAPADFTKTELIWLDRSGRRLGRIPLTPASYADGAFSADGSKYMVSEWGEGTANLWLVDVARNLATRFTFVAAENFDPMWSPDGSRVVFVSGREGRENLYIKPTNGSLEEKRLLDSGTLFTKTETWGPDGRFIVFSTLTKETGVDLWIYAVDGGASPKPLLATRFNEGDAAISPDGRWMVYRCNETGRGEMYVRSFPDMGEKYRISDSALGTSDASNFFWYQWRRDGREIVYPGADGRTVVSVAVSTGPAFHASAPRALFRLPRNTFWFAMHPGGEKFLATAPDDGGVPPSHTVILNWPQVLPKS